MKIEIGSIKSNSRGFEFEVIEFVKTKPRNKYRIRFLNTGYETLSDSKEINNGCIKDPYAPYVCGVGAVGIEIIHPQSHYLYDRWRDMLRRCYDEKNILYKDYGAKGVTVCNEWKYFPNYVRDIESKENSEKLKIDSKNWQIDKDIKYKNNKIYSKDTTLIVTRVENIRERNTRQDNPSKYSKVKVLQLNSNGEIIEAFNSITEAANKFGLSTCSCINACCRDKGYTFKGFYWVYECNYIDSESFMMHISERKEKDRESRYKYRLFVKKEGEDLENEFLGHKKACEYIGVTETSIHSALKRSNSNVCKCNGYIIRSEER